MNRVSDGLLWLAWLGAMLWTIMTWVVVGAIAVYALWALWQAVMIF